MEITDHYLGRLAREASGDDLHRLAGYVQELAYSAALLDLWDRGAIHLIVGADGQVTYRPVSAWQPR